MVFYFHAPSCVLFGFTVVQIITEWGNTHFISIFLQKNLHGKFAPKTAKNLDFLEVFCGYIFFIASFWRRMRDLNFNIYEFSEIVKCQKVLKYKDFLNARVIC